MELNKIKVEFFTESLDIFLSKLQKIELYHLCTEKYTKN